MKFLSLALLLISAVVIPTGCASDSNAAAANDTVDANGQQVSSVPWNKPEQWETAGQLGGLSQ